MTYQGVVMSIGAVASLLGCAAIPRSFIDPQVQLRAVGVRALDLTGGTLDLHLDVYNPNRFDLRGTRLELGFDVDGSHVGDIALDDDFNVADGDTTRVVLPLRFTWTGANAAARAALNYGEIPYTMKGQVQLDTPIGARVVPFTRSGRAPLSRGS
jgi:hypothetical protein